MILCCNFFQCPLLYLCDLFVVAVQNFLSDLCGIKFWLHIVSFLTQGSLLDVLVASHMWYLFNPKLGQVNVCELESIVHRICKVAHWVDIEKSMRILKDTTLWQCLYS